MIFEGEWQIPADRAKVWEALNDPEVLRTCIPDCQSLEKHSDSEFESRIRVSVGPVSSVFHAKITLDDIDPERGYTISGEGKSGAAGFAHGKASVALDDEEGGTRLRYRADVNIGGKLAQVGSRLIQGTARKLTEQFFSCLSEQLTPEHEERVPETQAVATASDKLTPRLWLWTGAAAVILFAVILWWVLR